MTNLPIEEVEATIRQIEMLRDEGADLVRLAVRGEDSIIYLKEIRSMIDMPLSADIHFNYRIAIKAIKAGIDKVRINPGNIGDQKRVKEIVRVCKEFNVPIRIGVNSGSIDRKRFQDVSAQSLVASALEHINILEDSDFYDIIVSIKSSDLFHTIAANRLFSSLKDYPLHIGLTEAGFGVSCVVHSAIAIGSLLLEGIGDTIRVSMTGDPVEEIVVAKRILESVGMRNPVIRVISCPTCGRIDPSVNLLDLATAIEEELMCRFGNVLQDGNRNITVAVMGCEVNGPGEASHADVGVAACRGGEMLLFSEGQRLNKIMKKDAVASLKKEVEKIISLWKK